MSSRLYLFDPTDPDAEPVALGTAHVTLRMEASQSKGRGLSDLDASGFFRFAEACSITVPLAHADWTGLLSLFAETAVRFPAVAPMLLHEATLRALLETS